MKTCAKSSFFVKQVKLICASILMLGASAVYAEPAAVIDDFFCQTELSDGNGGSLYFSTTNESHKVITDKGVRILTCHFDHTYVLTDAIGAQGFLCGISSDSGLKLTSNSKLLVAPGGRATLLCKINGDSYN
jgi:hypothetical protein